MADTAQIKITADTSQAERALGSLNNSLKGLVTVAGITAMAKFADSLTNVQNKLALVTQEGQSSNQLFQVMTKSAMNLGAPLKDVSDLFFRVANNTKDLGLAQTDQVKITETLIKGFQLTGQTMGETQGAIVQLGQAFSQGVLRGDELNSVLEQLPMVADAIAAKFGVQRGALKALGEQGRITSKDLSDAILASGESIDRAWGNRIPTIAQSFSRLETAMGAAFQQGGIGEGISNALSLALLKIANALVSVINFFETWGGVILNVIEILALIYYPVRGAIAVLAGLERAAVVVGEAMAWMAKHSTETLAGLAGMVTALMTPIIGLFDGIRSLFSKDNADAASKYKNELDKLNKSLGLDTVEASGKAKAATAGLTAEQVKNAESIRKATQTRDETLRKLMQTQTDINTLTQYTGDEYEVQSTILKTNRDLVKEILDSNGKHLGYTRAMNSEETARLETLLKQTEILKQQQTLKGLTAPESTSGVTSRASNLFGNTQEGLNVEAQRQQAALDVLKTNKLISEQQFADQSIVIERQRTDALLALDQKLMEARLKTAGVTNQAISTSVMDQMNNIAMMSRGGVEAAQGALGAMDNIMSSMGTYNRQAFEQHKKLATVMALISTYQAVATSLATIPWPFSMVAAVGALAAGMAQVSAIQSQSYSGRALGGPVQSGTSYIVGERGPELFTPSSSGGITRNDHLGGGKDVNINFNIQANDASGFDSLLMERRGMITQFVRDAMAEQGTRSRM